MTDQPSQCPRCGSCNPNIPLDSCLFVRNPWHESVSAASPQPSAQPGEVPSEISRELLQLLKIAAKIARREYFPSLEKCRTIHDARAEVARYDDYQGVLAMDLKAVHDDLIYVTATLTRQLEEAQKRVEELERRGEI